LGGGKTTGKREMLKGPNLGTNTKGGQQWVKTQPRLVRRTKKGGSQRLRKLEPKNGLTDVGLSPIAHLVEHLDVDPSNGKVGLEAGYGRSREKRAEVGRSKRN